MTYIPDSLMFAGMMLPYCGIVIPNGWLWCHGQAIDRLEFDALFSAIGTKYGSGDGVNTFNVPDFRGRILISSGTGFGLSARTEGQKNGQETHTLTIPEIPAHTHSLPKYPSPAYYFWPGSDGDNGIVAYENLSSTGGGGAHNNMQPYVVIQGMLIKY
jgi:microcystin-dependent protein